MNFRYVESLDSPFKVEPLTLRGSKISLEPLELAHVSELWNLAQDESIWQWIPSRLCSYEDTNKYVTEALKKREIELEMPFVIRLQSTQEIVGSTRFMNIFKADRRVEIGSTWLTPAWQRSFVNTEAKLLLLSHAFEILRCIRVELKTDVFNEKSRRAIERIGAKPEGILRNHKICADGRIRDTIYYSLTYEEWPAAKARLQERLK